MYFKDLVANRCVGDHLESKRLIDELRVQLLICLILGVFGWQIWIKLNYRSGPFLQGLMAQTIASIVSVIYKW